jgi:spermidine/putrescine-binding protein
VDLEVVGDDVERSWAVLFEPGVLPPAARAVMLDDPRESLGAALRYLGHSLNTTDEDEIRQAGELIEASRPRIASFDSDSGEDLLLAGEIAAVQAYSGDLTAAVAEAEDPGRYEYFIPEEGGVRWVDAMVIASGAEHPCSAHAFMDFLLDPEHGAQLSEWNSYASPNAAATELIDPALLEDPAVYPPPEVEARLEFIDDVGPATDLYTRTFALARD